MGPNFFLLLTFAFSFSAFAVDISFDVGGVARSARIIPSSVWRLAYPTIIALHGGGGNREELERDARLPDYTRPRGVLLVLAEGTGPRYPSGKIAGSWNAGRCCGPAMVNQVDDIAYLRTLIERVVRDHKADPKAIAVVGFSNGAKMAYRAACELPDRIAAIGAVGGVGVFESQVRSRDHCLPGNVPTIQIHGKADVCSPPGGGDVYHPNCVDTFVEKLTGIPPANAGELFVSLEDAESFFDYWSKRMGYAHLRATEPFPGHYRREYGTGPFAERKTKLWLLDGVGHTWPGGRYSEPCTNPLSFTCWAWRETVAGPKDGLLAPYPLFDASQEIVDFFLRVMR